MENIELDINKKISRDLKYIETDIICKQKDFDKNEQEDKKEKFLKFSRPLNAISVMDMTKAQYKQYWKTQYLKFPPEYSEKIMKAIEEKFENGLTSKKDMIEIIKNSNDRLQEKMKAIDLLNKTKNERDPIKNYKKTLELKQKISEVN